MNYLLDTDTCIYLMTDREPQRRANILAHLEALPSDEIVYLSSVTVLELSYGAHKGRWSKANTELLEEFLLDFAIAPFDEKAARIGGALRASADSQERRSLEEREGLRRPLQGRAGAQTAPDVR